MKNRKVIVYDLNDFICRCGSSKLQKLKTKNQVNLKCSSCGRLYRVEKKEKKMRISNLPMSFGYRSLYWNEIEVGENGLSGKMEEQFEITEIEGPTTDSGKNV